MRELDPIDIIHMPKRRDCYILDMGNGTWEVSISSEIGYQFTRAIDAVTFLCQSTASMRCFAAVLTEAADKIERSR